MEQLCKVSQSPKKVLTTLRKTFEVQKKFYFCFKKTQREREKRAERERKKNDRGKGRSSKGFLSQNTLFAEN
jgi:hypothetical protein